MAYKKKAKASKGEAKERPSKESEASKKLLKRVLERSKIMIEADAENRSAALADLKFVNVPGSQWDDNMKKEREGRPCLEANTLRINGKRIINEIRSNRPQGQVKAVEGGDKEGAELREGLVRNILQQSDFESITDYEAEYQVDCGLGAWRVDTQYSDEDVFDQDIKVNPFKNPLCLYWDPASKDLLLKRDAEDWLVLDTMSVKAYEAEYGEAEQFDFTSDADDLSQEDWEEEETVRVCEYWYKEPYDKELVQVKTPTGVLVVDTTSDEWAGTEEKIKAREYQELRRRLVHCHRIMMCVASGKSILKGPVEFAGDEFPFVVAHGEIKVVDGKVRWFGLHRFSKDAQQIQNVFWTAAAEAVALAPKAYDWVTATQAEGHLAEYAEAHTKNIPIRVYNSDPTAPGPPQHVPGAQVPVAMLEMVGLSGQLIRTTSGLHEASFGEESDEKSGIALARKQRQAQIVTYNFPDNMAKAAKRTGEIILSLIPVVYDAERELRVLGVDGAEDYARVNEVVFDPGQGKSVRVNDLTSGKYDYYVKSGPSYSSQREEAAEIYGELVQKFPEMMQVGGDLVFKASDLPYSDEMAKRMQHLLLPAVQKQISEGKELPPEAQAAVAQAERAMALAQQQSQLVQQAAQDLQKEQAKATADKAGVEKAIANLRTEEAKFETKVERAKNELLKAEMALSARETEVDAAGAEVERKQSEQKEVDEVDRADKAELMAHIHELRTTLAEFDKIVAGYMGAQGQAMTDLQGQVKRPQLKGARTRRDGEGLLAEIELDDGSVKRMRMARQNGELVAIPINDTAAPTRPN